MATQCELILKDLKKGRKINPLRALKKYNCFRLSARISDLKSQGYKIKTQMVDNETGTKQFAEYSLEIEE